MSWKKMNNSFFVICLLTTIGLSSYSMYRYLKNEDVTVVKVLAFLSSPDAIYPSFSFCILQPFLKDRFNDYNDDDINMTSYIRFLKGDMWDDRFLKIEYDNVTVDLSDNLMKAEYNTHSNWEYSNWEPIHFVSFRSSGRKCFTVNAPFLETHLLRSFRFEVDKKIIPDANETKQRKVYTYLHYPGQRFTSYYTVKPNLISHRNLSSKDRISFTVRDVDVITRRNKKNEPCVEDWRHYDDQYMQRLMKKVGCHPPHWKSEHDLPICSDASQMKSFSGQPNTFAVESFGLPCKMIDRLQYFSPERNLKG